jgi:hypothetical protein
MKEFFAHLYGWFGLFPIYSKDLDDFLRGWDYACVGYFALPWYIYIGLMMIVLTVLIFALQYDLISSDRFKSQEHWELSASVVITVNFVVAFTIPAVAIFRQMHCPALQITLSDCVFFGISNAVWSFILFCLLSGLERLRLKYAD